MRLLRLLVGRLLYWLGLPVLYFYLKKDERTRVIVRCGDEVLLLKGWLSSGHWMLPGGGIHRGEEPARALLREVKEETGISLLQRDLQYFGKHEARDTGGLRYTYHVYVTELTEKPPIALQVTEISEAAWMPLQQIIASPTLTQTTRHILETWS